MAEQSRVVAFEGKNHSFPSDFTDAEISAALGAIPAANTAAAPKAKTWTDLAVNALPAVGATVGGVLGGVGGTAFGMGFGGVPGAVGGAGLGGGAGEAAKQLINRMRGADAPATASEAAGDIGLEAAEDAAVAGVLGGAGKLVGMSRGSVAKALQVGGKEVAKPHSVKRLVGKGMQAVGKAIEPAADVPKVKINNTDFLRIKDLIAQGISEREAVRTVLNLRAKAGL